MIRLLCIGKLKEPHYAAACAEYLKRLSRYVRLDSIEFRECDDKNPQVEKRKEAQLIQEKLHDGSYVVALDARSKQVSSEEFAQILARGDVTFIIGGPEGLAQEIIDEADYVLSLSKMTFPHQLARVILVEQIYRGYTILKGEKYHK